MHDAPLLRRLNDELRRARRVSADGRARPGADIVLAVGLLLAGLLPLGIEGLELGDLPDAAPPWANLLLTAGLSLPLIVRRRYPAASLVVIAGVWAIGQFVGATAGLAGLGLLVALYSTARHQAQRRTVLAVVAVLAYVGTAVVLAASGSTETVVDYITFFAVLVVPWMIGRSVRANALLEAARRSRESELAVQAARQDLARDLHDVVTHNVTAIVVQAESAAYLDADDRQGREETLGVVALAGRRALAELRDLLGVLDPNTGDTEPQRSEPEGSGRAVGVIELVANMRAEGHDVSLELEGAPIQLTGATDSALLRCAQESITNALKHAPGSPVALHLINERNRVSLRVTNPVADSSPALVEGSGRGLKNMSHRVELLGGDMSAARIGSCFEVSIHLPLDRS